MSIRCTIALLVLAIFSGLGDRDTRERIVIVPIGPVPADVLTHLQEELPAALRCDVRIGNEIPVPAFDRGRRQYRGSVLLELLAAHDDGTADRVLGIIDADAYAPGLNFIFGQARKPGRFAVIALARLRSERERAVKVSVHELGHSFGYSHCETDRCVMSFARSVGDVDRQYARFCGRESRSHRR